MAIGLSIDEVKVKNEYDNDQISNSDLAQRIAQYCDNYNQSMEKVMSWLNNGFEYSQNIADCMDTEDVKSSGHTCDSNNSDREHIIQCSLGAYSLNKSEEYGFNTYRQRNFDTNSCEAQV